MLVCALEGDNCVCSVCALGASVCALGASVRALYVLCVPLYVLCVLAPLSVHSLGVSIDVKVLSTGVALIASICSMNDS